MKKKLDPAFFDRVAHVVAKDLLGKFLVRKIDGREVAVMITEVEAYAGPEDLASHARFGKTARTTPMFGPPGTIYIFFTYGMHWMLNIACGNAGEPSAVLIRGVEGFSGPARLTKFLGIDKNMNGKLLGRDAGLWIEDRGVALAPSNIVKTPRIGIAYAWKWVSKPWRFVLRKRAPK